MSEFRVDLDEIAFNLHHVADLDGLAALDGFEHVEPEVVDQLLAEAARFAQEVIAPLNRVGDTEGARRLDDGSVVTPTGFREAYRAYVQAGWGAVSMDPDYGGGGFPHLVGLAVEEMFTAACMSWSLCPLLTQGAINMLGAHGTDEQRALYLPQMATGAWTGTMNLTEPQAGSDLGAVIARAVPQADGSYRLYGTKIFITYGEHDLADNIVHLVLARTPGAPPGTRGVSCFLVPKHLPSADGSAGERNDVRCVSIEHKLGIHASPTCVMAYGDTRRRSGIFGRGGERRNAGHVHDDETTPASAWGCRAWPSPSGPTSRPSPTPTSAARAGRRARPPESPRPSSTIPTCGGCCWTCAPPSAPCGALPTATPRPSTAPRTETTVASARRARSGPRC